MIWLFCRITSNPAKLQNCTRWTSTTLHLENKFPSLRYNFCLIPVIFCGLCYMFYRRFLKPFSNLKIFFQNSNFFGLWGPFLRFFWKLKILSFFENFHSGHVAHVLYPIFEAIFDFENIFSKFSFFWPLGPIFWKNSKFWVFLKNFFGGMWHMFYIQFLKPFWFWNYFFEIFIFLASGAHILKNSKFRFF